MQADSTQTAWHAMSATYRSELITAAQLRQRGIECYLPLQLVEREHRGKRIKVRIPLIGNLLFIHSTRRTIQLVKQEMPRLQYKMFREKDCPPHPIIVPDRDMQNFIRATGGYAGVKVSALDDSCIPQGSRVRVNGGPMDEAEYMAKVYPTRRELEYTYVQKAGFWYDAKMIVYTVIFILYAVVGKECTWILKEFLRDARESNPEIEVMPER